MPPRRPDIGALAAPSSPIGLASPRALGSPRGSGQFLARNKKLLIGGAAGAAALILGYTLLKNRSAVPQSSIPSNAQLPQRDTAGSPQVRILPRQSNGMARPGHDAREQRKAREYLEMRRRGALDQHQKSLRKEGDRANDTRREEFKRYEKARRRHENDRRKARGRATDELRKEHRRRARGDNDRGEYGRRDRRRNRDRDRDNGRDGRDGRDRRRADD